MKKVKYTIEQIEEYGFNNPDGPTEEQMAAFVYDRLCDLDSEISDEGTRKKLKSLGKEEFIKMMVGIELIEEDDEIGLKINYMPDYFKTKH